MQSAIHFNEPWGENGWLSPTSSHPVTANGVEYPTMANYVMRIIVDAGCAGNAPFDPAKLTPAEALAEVRKAAERAPMWWVANIEHALWRAASLKAEQHADVRAKLAATPITAEFVFDFEGDVELGVGPTGTGHNRLGEAWREVRCSQRE